MTAEHSADEALLPRILSNQRLHLCHQLSQSGALRFAFETLKYAKYQIETYKYKHWYTGSRGHPI